MTRERENTNWERAAHQEAVTALRNLPQRTPPPGLRTSLRVIASRERQKLLSRQRRIDWRDRVQLFVTNLMRPMALPLAGGLFSTVLLFSMCVAPAYPMLHAGASDAADVSTVLSTDPAVKRTAAIGMANIDVVVDVTVDSQGRMVDYKVVSGHITDEALRVSLTNRLLFTLFTPATQFGQPAAGKVRVSLRSSSVDVKG